MGRLLSPVLTRAGQPAFLAARYLRGTGVQSAVSVGALITAVALFVALVIMIHSFRGTVQTWVNQTVSGDLFIQPQMAWINQHKTPLSDPTVSMLRRLGMDADLVPYRRFHLQYGQTPYLLEAVDMERFFRHGDFSWIRGDIPWVRQELIQGKGVLVSQVFAHRTGLGVGTSFRDTVAGQTAELPILGVVRDYRTHGGVVFTDTRLWDGAWSGVRIFFRSKAAKSQGQLRQWEQRIRSQSPQRIDIRQGAALRQEILTIFDQTFAVTTVLLVIALAVAALGIATTLTVRVLERVWELNTLSAIGADIAQIRAMILWEALLMVIPGELAGLIAGMILAYLLIFVINLQSFGWTFILDIPWHTLAWALPLIMGTALVAALPAVRMAFQTPPAAILRENR
jgi:putative ABC transport system permease protein